MRARATDPGEIWWAQYEPYFDTSDLVEILGTTVDTIHQASADGAVKYLATADGVALMPTAQFPSPAGLVPQLGEMTARWVPCDRTC